MITSESRLCSHVGLYHRQPARVSGGMDMRNGMTLNMNMAKLNFELGLNIGKMICKLRYFMQNSEQVPVFIRDDVYI